MKKYLLFVFFASCISVFAQTEAEMDSIAQRYELSNLTIEGKKSLKRGDRIVLDNLNFKGGTAELLKESKPSLEKLLKIMQDNPRLRIQIQGHICCVTDMHNEVSEARARVVWIYLLLNEIENDRLTFRDYGASRPIYTIPERDEMQRKANRRVEIEVISN